MITHKEMSNQLLAEPFEPFVIHTASGRTFAIPHPEFLQIGKTTCTVFTPPANDPNGPERWEKISLMLCESIAPLSDSNQPKQT